MILLVTYDYEKIHTVVVYPSFAMKRLVQENKNTAEEYNMIFFDRLKKGVDQQDVRRWKRLVKPFRGGRLLDSGCLDSHIPVLAKLRHKDADVWGIDIAEQAIAAMKDLYPFVNYEVRDVYDTKFEDGYFDYVVMGEVLEHLEEPARAIQEAMRILKPKGTLALSVPLDEAKERGAVDAIHHIWSYTMKDILDVLMPYGRVKTGLLGSQYFPVYRYAWPIVLAFVRKK